jgi:hypothetical protein
MKQAPTKWEATDTPGLYVRKPGGAFYSRITLNGKRTWRSLETDKLREAQRRHRDLQSGHARNVSTRSDDTLHAAMARVIEFRSIRRGISRPLKKRTEGYHKEILGIAQKLFPNRPLAAFEAAGVLRIIQGSGYGQSRRKAIFELLKRTFADGVDNGVISKNPLAGQVPGQVPKKERVLPTREQLEDIMSRAAEKAILR